MRVLTLLLPLTLATLGVATFASAGEPGTLIVHARPASRVLVDGTDRGTTPIRMELAPGTHEITLEQEGRRRSFTRDVNPGKTTSFAFVWK